MSFLRKVADNAPAFIGRVFAFAWMAIIFVVITFGLLMLVVSTVAVASESPGFLPYWLGIIVIGGAILWFFFRCGRPVSFEKLQKKGLIETCEFEAKRAFGIEDDHDQGPGYFIELADGGVLFLWDPYLYEFEEIDDAEVIDDPELAGPRRFPCSRFVTHRHKTKRYLMKLEPLGDVIVPEGTAPYFSREDAKNKRIPDDGDIIRDRTYDELKSERFGGSL